MAPRPSRWSGRATRRIPKSQCLKKAEIRNPNCKISPSRNNAMAAICQYLVLPSVDGHLGPACGCGCGGGSPPPAPTNPCGCGCGCGGGTAPSPAPAAAPAGAGTCGCSENVNPLVCPAQQSQNALKAQAAVVFPGQSVGPASIDHRFGGVTLELAPPSTSEFGPVPRFNYNSTQAYGGIQFGNGWADVFNPTVTPLIVTNVTGYVSQIGTSCVPPLYTFGGRLFTGYTNPPPDVANSLYRNSDKTFTDARPDLFQNYYDSNGLLKRMANLAGARWTTARSGSLLTRITNPFNQRTTYAYDGSNNLRHIQDCAGRLTSFTVNASGNLSRMIHPDGSRMSLSYDGSHNLTQIVDKDGSRTTFAYDAYSRVTGAKLADGTRNTYA